MLVVFAIIVLLCSAGVVYRRSIARLLSDQKRRRTLQNLDQQCPRPPKPRTIFTRISGNCTAASDHRPSRSSIGETIGIRKSLASRAISESSMPTASKPRKELSKYVSSDCYNYFPSTSSQIPSPEVHDRRISSSFKRPMLDRRFEEFPLRSSKKPTNFNAARLVHAQPSTELPRSPKTFSTPSIARRKRLALSASDGFKSPRISMGKRSSPFNNYSAPASAIKRSKFSEGGLSHHSKLYDSDAHHNSSSADAVSLDLSEIEMQDELTVEMPADAQLDSFVPDKQADESGSKRQEEMDAQSEFEEISKIPERFEPDLPHSDMFNSHRRLSRTIPKRQLPLDDMLFDDEEIRLKFQRNDKEVLDILQSYVS